MRPECGPTPDNETVSCDVTGACGVHEFDGHEEFAWMELAVANGSPGYGDGSLDIGGERMSYEEQMRDAGRGHLLP